MIGCPILGISKCILDGREKLYLKKVHEFSVSSPHFIRIHDLMSSTILEDLLIKIRILLKLAVREQFLALLIVCCQNQPRQDGAKFPNLMYDAFRFGHSAANDVNLVSVFGNLQGSLK